MPRKLRVEFPGAIDQVLSWGGRREDLFQDEVDRQDFLKTLAEACQKTGFEVQLRERRKSDALKLALAARLRRETTLTVGWIANRLHMRTRKSVTTRLREYRRAGQKPHGEGNNVVVDLLCSKCGSRQQQDRKEGR